MDAARDGQVTRSAVRIRKQPPLRDSRARGDHETEIDKLRRYIDIGVSGTAALLGGADLASGLGSDRNWAGSGTARFGRRDRIAAHRFAPSSQFSFVVIEFRQ